MIVQGKCAECGTETAVMQMIPRYNERYCSIYCLRQRTKALTLRRCPCGEVGVQCTMVKYCDIWYCNDECIPKEEPSCPSKNEPPDGSIYL